MTTAVTILVFVGILCFGSAAGSLGFLVLRWLTAMRRQNSALRTLISARDAETQRAMALLRAKSQRAQRELARVTKALDCLSQGGPKSLLTTEAFCVEADKRMLELVELVEEELGPKIGERMSAVAKATWAECGQSIRESEGRVRESLETIYRQVEGLFALYAGLGPGLPLPALRGWAVSPDLAAHLVRTVLKTRPSLVVEAGSGVSTLLMGLALRQLGEGRVIALEHDRRHAEATCHLLQRFDVRGSAEVILAPLIDYDISGTMWRWYDKSGLESSSPVDILFVDGPPSEIGPRARYPALPLLVDRLPAGALVVLDDARRPDESGVVNLWLAQYDGFSLEMLDHEKGTAQLRRRAG
jgi:predicted O-methyltransferase YrrM